LSSTYITVTAHGKSEETRKQYLISGPRRDGLERLYGKGNAALVDHEELVVLKKDHGMVARNMGISDHQVFLLRPTVKGEWSSVKVRDVTPCTSRRAGNAPIPKPDIGAVAKAMIASGI
jgi:hypothetical protein